MKDVEAVTDDNNLKQEIRNLRIVAGNVQRRTMQLSNELYFKDEMEKYGKRDDFVNMNDEEFAYFMKARAESRGEG